MGLENLDDSLTLSFSQILGATNKLYIYVCYVYDSFNKIQTTTIEKA